MTANERVYRSLRKISNAYLGIDLKELISIGQSIELYEKLKDKYYVVNHGQNNTGIVANIVAKTALKLFEGRKQDYFEVLRHDVFLQDIPKDRDVNWYKKEIGRGSHVYGELITDHFFVNELISGDINLESVEPAESAVDFFCGRCNIAVRENPDLINEIICRIVKKYFPREEKLSKQIAKKITEASKGLGGGTLYSICIPKERFESIAYLSKAYGSPLEDSFTTPQDLLALQEGTSSVLGTQVRLLASKLSQENGVVIISHTTLSKERLSEIEGVVEKCLSPTISERLRAKF